MHKPGNIVGAKDSHEIVLERQIKTAGAGISLATGSTPELIVNAPSLMSLGTNNVNSTQFEHLIVLLLPNRRQLLHFFFILLLILLRVQVSSLQIHLGLRLRGSSS